MALPTGRAVVLVFADIEGSTRLEAAVETVLATPAPVARPEGFEPPTY